MGSMCMVTDLGANANKRYSENLGRTGQSPNVVSLVGYDDVRAISGTRRLDVANPFRGLYNLSAPSTQILWVICLIICSELSSVITNDAACVQDLLVQLLEAASISVD